MSKAALARYRAKNREKINAKARARYMLNKEKESLRHKIYVVNNRNHLQEYMKLYDAQPERRARKVAAEKTEKTKAVRRAWKLKNQEQQSAYHKSWEKNYRERRKQLHVEKQNDIQYRLRRVLRSRLKQAIKKNFKKGSAVTELGCSIDALKGYLESQFIVGMTWDNFGRLDVTNRTWQIDHVRPLSSFDLTDFHQLRQACHFSNLAPLWALDNRRKANKTTSGKEVPNAF